METAVPSTMPGDFRRTHPMMRAIFGIASVLVGIAGIQLFILARQTDTYFAWTVNPPITAAFLGAQFFGSMALTILAAREKYWARARAAVPGVFAFTTMMLLTTLLHLSRFHWTAPQFTARFAAWAWLIVYAAVPPLLVVGLLIQRLSKGDDASRTSPLPRWVLALVTSQAVIRLAAGVTLYLLPAMASRFWPWMLTPLTARAVGSWLIGLAIGGFAAVRENDAERVRPSVIATVALGLLEVAVLARFPAGPVWKSLPSLVYSLVLLSVFLSAIGALRAKKA
jgi:hypothetical protein